MWGIKACMWWMSNVTNLIGYCTNHFSTKPMAITCNLIFLPLYIILTHMHLGLNGAVLLFRYSLGSFQFHPSLGLLFGLPVKRLSYAGTMVTPSKQTGLGISCILKEGPRFGKLQSTLANWFLPLPLSTFGLFCLLVMIQRGVEAQTLTTRWYCDLYYPKAFQILKTRLPYTVARYKRWTGHGEGMAHVHTKERRFRLQWIL